MSFLDDLMAFEPGRVRQSWTMVGLGSLILAGCAAQFPSGTTAVPSAREAAASSTLMERANPDMRAVLQALQSMGGRPIETLSAQEARAQPTPTDAAMQVIRQQGIVRPPLDVANVEDRTIAGDAGPIPIRIYTPGGGGPFPIIVYYHGGGWVISNLDTYASSARALAHYADAIVVSAHYRQAPQHKFPDAHEDAFKAYQWVVANAQALRGDPEKIALAGESAGGNLAMNVAIQARNTGTTQPVHEVLVYPVAGTDMNTPSYQENANARPLNKPMMEWFFRQYLNNPDDYADPRINLIAADLRGLPPTTIIGAEIDPLRSEGVTLYQRLEAVGVPVTYQLYDGVTHEFFGMGTVVADALDAEELAGLQLKRAFGTAGTPEN